MNNIILNFARKWRSTTFDEVVGQDLSIKMLKNSLYLNKIFPVYLFSGQRGCGKTTTARIFAKAINCQKLDFFQKDPLKIKLPCLECDSCIAMANLSHPDFIEVDAASNTGVDNIRSIIDASSFLPVMGKKRIYLIDEAHMLSKSAFNAFLKVLEEPSPYSVFMLATTDYQKIIDTVRSRCFQLFFKPISIEKLSNHLASICDSENIKYDQNALILISKESDGSARDALNLLEQVNFAFGHISCDSVNSVLGQLPDEKIIKLLQILFECNLENLLIYLKEIAFESASHFLIYKKLYDISKNLLYEFYDVKLSLYDEKSLNNLTSKYSVEQASFVLSVLYEYELVLVKTTNTNQVMHSLFLKLMTYNKETLIEKKNNNLNHNGIIVCLKKEEIILNIKEKNENIVEHNIVEQKIESVFKIDNNWNGFILEIEKLSEPLIISIFKQAKFEKYDLDLKNIHISFDKKNTFFSDLIEDSKLIWTPILNKYFESGSQFIFNLKEQINLNLDIKKKDDKLEINIAESDVAKNSTNSKLIINSSKDNRQSFNKNKIDFSDELKWPIANYLINELPGVLTEVEDSEKFS